MAADHAQLEAAVDAVDRTRARPGPGRPRPRSRPCGAAGAGCHWRWRCPLPPGPASTSWRRRSTGPRSRWPGVEEVDLEFVVMDEHERAALRQRLRAGMLGTGPGDGIAGASSDEASSETGHAHGHGHQHGRRNHLCRPSWRRRYDTRHRRLVRQGRGRQVHGDGEPGHRLGASRPLGGPARRRRVRLLGSQDARHGPRPGDHRRHRRSDRRTRRPLPVDGVLRPRRPAGHLAGADVAQGDPAVPDRRLLG